MHDVRTHGWFIFFAQHHLLTKPLHPLGDRVAIGFFTHTFDI